MKTRSKFFRAFKSVALIYFALIFGNSVYGQADPYYLEVDDVSEAYNRLEVFMDSVQLTIRYEAPEVIGDDVHSPGPRRELIATQPENKPGLDDSGFAGYESTDEYLKEEKKNANNGFLSFFQKLVKKK
jgi:hypothetical protein